MGSSCARNPEAACTLQTVAVLFEAKGPEPNRTKYPNHQLQGGGGGGAVSKPLNLSNFSNPCSMSKAAAGHQHLHGLASGRTSVPSSSRSLECPIMLPRPAGEQHVTAATKFVLLLWSKLRFAGLLLERMLRGSGMVRLHAELLVHHDGFLLPLAQGPMPR